MEHTLLFLKTVISAFYAFCSVETEPSIFFHIECTVLFYLFVNLFVYRSFETLKARPSDQFHGPTFSIAIWKQ